MQKFCSKANLAVLSTKEIVDLEQSTVKQGISFSVLMKRAGLAVFNSVIENFKPQPTMVLCGPGNNGGDGYVVAKLLYDKGWPVTVARCQAIESNLSIAASFHKDEWEGETIELNKGIFRGYQLIIDGLFGVGLNRPIRGKFKEIIEEVNKKRITCVSIDIPSGINSDTGQIMGSGINADMTITFGNYKPGHFLLPGKQCIGSLILADIGLIKLDVSKVKLFVNDINLWRNFIPSPEIFYHKYNRGHALIVGSNVMTGAARLAAAASRRVGSGLVTIASSPEVQLVYSLSAPGLLTKSVKDIIDLKDVIKNKDAIAIGFGWPIDSQIRSYVLSILKTKKPCVLDAGALTSFQDEPDCLFSNLHENCVLTPHEGEFKKLFNYYKGSKIDKTVLAAIKTGAIIVHKGSDTVIASPNGDVLIQGKSSPYLATAGTGDVLAGIITGLLAQNVTPFYSAAIGVWIINKIACFIKTGLIAEDIIKKIPMLLKSM